MEPIFRDRVREIGKLYEDRKAPDLVEVVIACDDLPALVAGKSVAIWAGHLVTLLVLVSIPPRAMRGEKSYSALFHERWESNNGLI